MDFTNDWFSGNIPTWSEYLGPLKNKPVTALEIGSYEGRSAKWLLENILTHENATITCIDTFEGSMEHKDLGVDFSTTEQIFDFQVACPYANKVIKIKDTSRNALIAFNSGYLPWGSATKPYDLVYIDGSHMAADVMLDALLVWPLMAPGGILIFDDLEWNAYPEPGKTPKLAIQTFFEMYRDQLSVLHIGYQAIYQKAGGLQFPNE